MRTTLHITRTIVYETPMTKPHYKKLVELMIRDANKVALWFEGYLSSRKVPDRLPIRSIQSRTFHNDWNELTSTSSP